MQSVGVQGNSINLEHSKIINLILTLGTFGTEKNQRSLTDDAATGTVIGVKPMFPPTSFTMFGVVVVTPLVLASKYTD